MPSRTAPASPPATRRISSLSVGGATSRYSYGEATGITQTVRNYGASLAEAAKIAQLQGGNGNVAAIPRSSGPTSPAPPGMCSTACA
jgi:hypothetical protein